MTIVNYIGAGLLFCAIVIPVVLQYVLPFFDHVYNTIRISIYGLYLILYLCIQMVLAAVNNIKVPKVTATLRANNNNPIKSSNILVVGYREKEEYFRLCLESVKASAQREECAHVITVIDGDSDEDVYMANVFREIFENTAESTFITFEEPITLETVQNVVEQIAEYKYVCVMQPHRGKRSAMRTGFLMSIIQNVQTVLCTDSDTVLDEHVLENMVPLFADETLGGIAGNLGIYTKYDSYVSFLSTLRYWFAFNMERAYQSYNGYVMCISGPIGMYRTDCLRIVLDEWANQKFLGKECTYGDDRHLTNLILGAGHSIKYTPIATATTETPSDIIRFFRQQTRWSKSAYREALWSVQAIGKHNLLMAVDLLYLLLFPYVVMGYLLYVIWGGDWEQLQLYFIIISVAGAIKTLYGVLFNRNPETLFYILYIIPYVCIVFPAKLWGLFTLSDTAWGSAFRKLDQSTTAIGNTVDIGFLGLWNAMLLSGVGYKIYEMVSGNVQLISVIPLLVICSCFVLLMVCMCVYVYICRSHLLIGSTNP